MTDLLSSLSLGPVSGFVPSGTANGAGPDDPDDTTINAPPSDGPTCEVCGREVPLTPTGRRPKHPRCQDHKARTNETSGSNTGGGVRAAAADKRLQARIDAIVGDLQEGAGELAGTLSPIAPVTAGTLMLTSPAGIAALVRIAADYPRMLDGLEKAARTVPFIAVGKFIAGIMLAIMVDMGRMVPEGLAAEYLGVAEAAQRVGWEPPQKTVDGQYTVDNTGPAVPPPRFTMP